MSRNNRIPFYRNPVYRGIAVQITVLALVLWALYTIFTNTVANLNERGIQTGFGFLTETAPFAVGFSPFIDYKLGETPYWVVFLIGIQNTIIVSVLGILAATILGFIVGVARLSPNFLLSRFASVYVEIFRNTPLLLQIMFWNFAVFLPLFPGPRESITVGEEIFLNNRGLYLPKPILTESVGAWALLAAVVMGIFAIFAFNRWAKAKQYHTGYRPPGRLYGLLTLVVLVFLVFLIFPAPLSFEIPELGRFNLTGGIQVPLPLFSLWFALTTYTAAFIAENVRGGINSVSKGQTEAAASLGLKRPTMLRLVIIPQAMRVIIPPTISQYLNLTKNSSLAVAVAYEELVNLWAGIALNQTGQALVIIAMTILVYETLSLLTSGILNWYNRRVQVVER
ncbi:amino acid ABC transporter permease [Dichotomicrobium thermohalophilum]|uniref:Amino acid ABC transporter membrane protein 1 (PAAT family) n=1 Tax=Dichotomicrobium thermohalophilum TaxID=933063 RepID=A0A397Q377_9HYPH|nr:ABC transporter permease subunit [Dichotomicrobium thermohalophilum]RIA55816.1 amino acid ABC transporter membrane protein 1 (PAAT family) [Dichotomicrobium thermohalophilum]